jgi:hypothetical protein
MFFREDVPPRRLQNLGWAGSRGSIRSSKMVWPHRGTIGAELDRQRSRARLSRHGLTIPETLLATADEVIQ